MSIKFISVTAAILALALSSMSPSVAQSTRNVGGNNVGGNNVGGGVPNNIGGGGGYYNCVHVTLAGSTFVSVCGNQYTARLGNITCNGYVSQGRGMYLNQAPCNIPGQNFLGGSLDCNGNFCNWNPSRAGRAQGFRPEYVSASYS